MIEHFNIQALIRDRVNEPRFHIAAEKYIRIEFYNLKFDGAIGPFTYEGDIIVTCYKGEFSIHSDERTITLRELDQAVIAVGTSVKLICEQSGTIQIIWSPPYAIATPT